MIVNIQAVAKMYEQTSGKFTIEQERIDRQERYKGLYVQMVEPVVSWNIGHYLHVWTHALTQVISLVQAHVLIRERWVYI